MVVHGVCPNSSLVLSGLWPGGEVIESLRQLESGPDLSHFQALFQWKPSPPGNTPFLQCFPVIGHLKVLGKQRRVINPTQPHFILMDHYQVNCRMNKIVHWVQGLESESWGLNLPTPLKKILYVNLLTALEKGVQFPVDPVQINRKPVTRAFLVDEALLTEKVLGCFEPFSQASVAQAL